MIEKLPMQREDPFIQSLHAPLRNQVSRFADGSIDGVYVIFENISQPPFMLMTITYILESLEAR